MSVSDVEAAVRRMLIEHPDQSLPTVHALARAYRTSTRVVSRVLHTLRDEGLVDVRRGKKAVPVRPLCDVPVHMSPSEQVYRAIREGIEDGRYPSGTRLPKVDYFAVEHGVSYNTVRRALQRVVAHRLAHRQGRRIIAGAPTPAGPGRSSSGDPVIFMLQGNAEWWEETLDSDWIGPFSHGFMREVNLAGTQVVPVLPGRPGSSLLVQGFDRIRDRARELDYRFRGTLVVGQSWDYRRVHGWSIPDLVKWLTRLGRPVVWFDFIDEPENTRDTFDPDEYRSLAKSRRERRLFTRCSYYEAGGLQVALQTLYDLGHRRVGLPKFSDADNLLAGPRIEGLQRVAQQFPGMKLVVADAPGNPYASDRPVGPIPELPPRRWLRRLPREGKEFYYRGGDTTEPDTDRARLLLAGQALLPLLLDEGVTAVVSLNDVRARPAYLWLRTMGYRVPEDISLVSFDAVPRQLYPWQISSVDFGFGHLAWSAYHLIMQDVPVQRHGTEVRARARMNHTGSIGPARVDQGM